MSSQQRGEFRTMSNGDAENTEGFQYKADPLKSNSLDQEHNRPISPVQSILDRRQKKGNRASKSLAWIVSLVFHLLIVLFTAIHIAQNVALDDDDAVVAEVLRAEEVPKQRVKRPRIARTIQPDIQRTQTARPQRSLTTVQIPAGNGVLTIPSDNFEIGPDTPPEIPRIERPPVADGHRANITTEIPTIAPNRPDRPSIIDRIEPTEIPQENLVLEEPVHVPTVDANAKIQSPVAKLNRKPKYPEVARRAGKEGVVVLEATIGTDGKARDIKVLEGIGYGCDEAAIDALEKERFTPAKKKGKPVDARIKIPYRFKIED